LIISGDQKWRKTSFWSFLVTRNGVKPLFSHFWSPDAALDSYRIFSKDDSRLPGD